MLSARVRKNPPKIVTKARKAPVQDRSKETARVILTATARVLVDVGYDHASTNKVAEVAGVSIGSLYRYFPSKEALVAALIERHVEEMLAVCESKLVEMADAPLDAAAREIVRAILRAQSVNPRLHRILIQQVPRVGQLRNVDALQERFGVLVKAYLENRKKELRPKNIDLAVFMLVRAVEAVAHAAVLERPELLVDGEMADELAQMVLRYLV
ncbi:MAG TPA: TetR/AcrR family transcriptional regulator [Polyangiaceae bacterium]|jgi:AcrR family transcriptional regulator|nr:TetR/AcrR family transcriptional regulator [Polyangiaceae bacterium]